MIGSLFSGIGGLELGLERAGLGPVVWQVEIDPFCRQVLAKHWPMVDRSVEDVRHASSTTLAPVDVICGGFPCQDVSAAGKRAGLAGARSGLWYEYRRVLEELRPAGVAIENVASGASAWLPTILAQLAELGYRTRALGIAARDVGAPHRRARIFVVGVANADGAGRCSPRSRGRELSAEAESGAWRAAGRGGESRGALADPNRDRRQGLGRGSLLDGEREALGHDVDRRGGAAGVADPDRQRLWIEPGRCSGQVRPGAAIAVSDGQGSAQSGLDRGADGLPAGLDRRWPAGRGQPQHEWEPPRTVAARTLPHRAARCKSLGNAVVPDCALIAGLVLREMLEGR